VNGGCFGAWTAPLVTRRRCKTQGVMKLRVSGAPGASGVLGARSGSVWVHPDVYFAALELRSVALNGAGWGVESTTTNASLMTWLFAWVHEASLRARGG
jgi:hypothetical protein